MNLSKAIVVVLLACVGLLLIAMPPWGLCVHVDGSACADGRDCCPERGGGTCDTCSDFTPDAMARTDDSAAAPGLCIQAPVATAVTLTLPLPSDTVLSAAPQLHSRRVSPPPLEATTPLRC